MNETTHFDRLMRYRSTKRQKYVISEKILLSFLFCNKPNCGPPKYAVVL